MKPGTRSSRRAAWRAGAGQRQLGFTLIDVLVIIVLVGTVAGSLTVVFSRLAESSAESMRARQVLAVAQSLLNEVRAMPFSFCDPQDTRAKLAISATNGGLGCATAVDTLGPEPGESRYNAGNRFDGVSDYQGFAMPGAGCTGLCDIGANLLNAAGSTMVGCSARVNLTAATLPGVAAVDTNGRPQALRIDVNVSCPGGPRITLQGVRLRHSPRAV